MIWEMDLVWVADMMGLLPCRTFCECAVGPLEISQAKGFVGKCRHMILVEPNPQLATKAAYFYNMAIEKVAVGFESHTATMVDNNGSSYIEGTWAPTPKPEGSKYPINVVTFDSLDDGEIDIMVLDCEGMEFAVLSKMRSLPELFVVEIWEANPYKTEIFHWLRDRDYKLRLSSGPTNETRLYTLANSANP